MKKFALAFVSIIMISNLIIAQKKLFTVEEAVIDSYSTLTPSNLTQLKWIPGSNEYSFIVDSEGSKVLVKNRADSGKINMLVSLDELNEELVDNNFSKLNNFPTVNWYSNSEFGFWQDNTLLSFNVEDKDLAIINEIDIDSDNKKIAPNNKYVASTKENNLFLNLTPDDVKQITFDKNPDIVNGQAAHRREFGIRDGIFWSHASNYVAFYHMDQTMVTDYPIVDISEIPAVVKNTKYPMAGQTSHEVKVGIYDIATGNAIYLKTGEPKEQYLTNICWDPTEKYIYVAHVNRDQNHMRFIKYDVATGKQIKVLFEEKNEKYIEPQTTAYFLPTDDEKFIWLTRRDGWNHFYLYNTEGGLLRQVTTGDWEVIDFIGFDRKNEHLFFISNKDEIPGRHLYSVNISTGDIKKLTDKPGTHTISRNTNGNLFIDNHDSFDVPRNINIIDSNGGVQRVLHRAENPIANYDIGETKIFTISGKNDTDLYCRLITPPDFDETKKYPVIVYVYGGPHSQGVLNTWPFGRYDFWFLLMAQKGYIVFEIDNRGTANRGLEFEQATFRRLGTFEIEDQMLGVEYLKTLDYIDTDRLGVYGWSYGGFMATSLLLRTNDTFKAAAAGGTVTDWKFYEIMYGERYMDTPETNPKGYAESSVLNYVSNLNGKLLLVNGTSDPTVVWQNSLSFLKKAVELNKPIEYFPYVGHRHGVRGRDTIHLYAKLTQFFLDNLK